MVRHVLKAGLVAVAALIAAPATQAQEVTLKLHQFLPLKAAIPGKFLVPWAEKVEKDSGGRIKIEHYPSMQLGGKPPALIDQVMDGAVDIVWTLPGYTAGRFPKTEAFELPFMIGNAEQTSRALQAYAEKNLQDEYKGLKIIAMHTHGPGVLHTRTPVTKLADLEGMKLRGPTRVITQMLGALGAQPIGMPVPAVPESLSKGVIDGTALPWEVTVPLKIADLIDYHTEIPGNRGLYSSTFLVAMNKASYDRLPDDLKKVIDDNSGSDTAAWLGRVMDEADAFGRQMALDKGDTINQLDDAEIARWREAAQPVIDNWIKEMDGKGIDAKALIEDAKGFVDQYVQ